MSISRPAFTLVEILVVIAVIGMLIGLLLPAVQAARAAARRMQCATQIKQVALAVHNYADVHGVFPPARFNYTYPAPTSSKPDRTETIRHSFITFLLPFIEQNTIYQLYDFSVNFQHNINDPATKNHIPFLICPDASMRRLCRYGSADNAAHKKIVEYYPSDYAACPQISGFKTKYKNLTKKDLDDTHFNNGGKLDGILRFCNDTPTEKTSPVNFASVSDGLSNTLMVFECVARPFKWEKTNGLRQGDPDEPLNKEPVAGGNWSDDDLMLKGTTFTSSGQMFNENNYREIFSLHSGGCNFAFGDGRVSFQSDAISPDTFISLFTASAGD
ncbi:prepilin-type N-terminal cleavage/methylation domain-containing protein [Planctomycetales bacterium]|nr:prepilin-type N-terminal cleavage/methylation domain-containing protein [Planctomycetales bacterium]